MTEIQTMIEGTIEQDFTHIPKDVYAEDGKSHPGFIFAKKNEGRLVWACTTQPVTDAIFPFQVKPASGDNKILIEDSTVLMRELYFIDHDTQTVTDLVTLSATKEVNRSRFSDWLLNVSAPKDSLAKSVQNKPTARDNSEGVTCKRGEIYKVTVPHYGADLRVVVLSTSKFAQVYGKIVVGIVSPQQKEVGDWMFTCSVKHWKNAKKVAFMPDTTLKTAITTKLVEWGVIF